MESITDKIVRILSSIKPFEGLIHIDKIEQKIQIGGREIITDKYLESKGDMTFTSRPELPQSQPTKSTKT